MNLEWFTFEHRVGERGKHDECDQIDKLLIW